MKNGKALAVSLVLALLFATSAFAESRHLSWTRRGSSGHHVSRSAPAFHGSRSYRATPFHRGYTDGRHFYGQGRITRVAPYHGGYRVWLGGWGYPFFVPYRFWDPFRFRVGLFIGFPAFYDPYGYYSVYGPGYYGGYSDGYNDRYRDTTIAGTVQSIDLQSGVVTIDDNRSRRIIAALLPPRDNRVDDIHPGDYVVLSGDWVHGHRYDFDAARLERFDPRR